MEISIYSKSGCPNCVAAKRLLESKELPFLEFNVEKDNDAKMWLLYNHPEAKQMPQIFIDDQRVGGLAGLRVALNQLSLI